MRFAYLLVVLLIAGLLTPVTTQAYVEAPLSLGAVIQQSVYVGVLQVERVDRTKNLIIYRKLRDLKGTMPGDQIKHNIGRNGLRPGEWEHIMAWAEPGKTAVFFHNGAASETFIGSTWYQAYPGGEWWNMTHAEPFLLRSFAGRPEKLSAAVGEMLAGREVIVPCMVDGNKEDLHARRAKVQRVKASLKLLDYNPKRDFVGWGGEDIRSIAGLAGFNRIATLPRIDGEVQGVGSVDFDGDGKLDLTLFGPSRFVLLQNSGEGFGEVTLPNLSVGARAAVWADYNGDGRADLFLATPAGPRLFGYHGEGTFRDETARLPRQLGLCPTAAAWIDAAADGKPDLLLADAFHGLRLLKNNRPNDSAKFTPPKFGPWHLIGPFDNGGGRGFTTVYPPETEFDFAKKYKGVNGIEVAWQKRDFADGTVNSLAVFPKNDEVVCYVAREIEAATPTELPLSLGSDDTLTVWLNGEKLLAENVYRACGADQHQLTIHLKPGRNRLLLKIGNGSGDYAFYCKPGEAKLGADAWFVDATELFGLSGRMDRVDALFASDLDNDGRQDILAIGESIRVYRNVGERFVEVEQTGLPAMSARVGIAVGDFLGDGGLGLFIPNPNGRCRLFRNVGGGRFQEVPFEVSIPEATSAAWGDFNNDGRLDLCVGCLNGPNRCFENLGEGRFRECTTDLGLDRLFLNSSALTWADVDGDGRLDLLCNNDGQDSCVLFADAATPLKLPTIICPLPPDCPAIGSRVRLIDSAGRVVVERQVGMNQGRGGQDLGPLRLTASPGAYRVRLTDVRARAWEQTIVVESVPVRVTWPKAK